MEELGAWAPNLHLPHVARRLQFMKMNKLFYPVLSNLFGSQAIVQAANLLTQLIQQPG